MLMILARLVRSESFWAAVKVRSPHTSPEVCYIIADRHRRQHPMCNILDTPPLAPCDFRSKLRISPRDEQSNM